MTIIQKLKQFINSFYKLKEIHYSDIILKKRVKVEIQEKLKLIFFIIGWIIFIGCIYYWIHGWTLCSSLNGKLNSNAKSKSCYDTKHQDNEFGLVYIRRPSLLFYFWDYALQDPRQVHNKDKSCYGKWLKTFRQKYYD